MDICLRPGRIKDFRKEDRKPLFIVSNDNQRTWDILGGGLLSTAAKHGNLERAILPNSRWI